MRFVSFLLFILIASYSFGQSPSQGETSCTFADGKQITLRYPMIPHDKKAELPDGNPWPPDNQPIYLFSQADLTIGNVSVPAGAYGVYTVPGKKDAWNLIVTRDVKQDGKYDQSMDLGKVPMKTGNLSDATSTFTAYFGHIAPKTCTLRLDYGKERGSADFQEK